MSKNSAPADVRFWRFVLAVESGCWLWTGGKTDRGYGVFADWGWHRAHRWSYRHFIADIPDGLTIDHLCRVPSCVNPTHLEPVTMRENTFRSPIAPAVLNAKKTHCKWGHPFDAANTIVRPTGRGCKTCNRISARERWRAARLLRPSLPRQRNELGRFA